MRVHSLIGFRQCLDAQLAAAFNLEGNFSHGSKQQQQQKQRQMNMPTPSITARVSGRRKSHSKSDRGSSSSNTRNFSRSKSVDKSEGNGSNKAWCEIFVSNLGSHSYVLDSNSVLAKSGYSAHAYVALFRCFSLTLQHVNPVPHIRLSSCIFENASFLCQVHARIKGTACALIS